MINWNIIGFTNIISFVRSKNIYVDRVKLDTGVIESIHDIDEDWSPFITADMKCINKTQDYFNDYDGKVVLLGVPYDELKKMIEDTPFMKNSTLVDQLKFYSSFGGYLNMDDQELSEHYYDNQISAANLIIENNKLTVSNNIHNKGIEYQAIHQIAEQYDDWSIVERFNLTTMDLFFDDDTNHEYIDDYKRITDEYNGIQYTNMYAHQQYLKKLTTKYSDVHDVVNTFNKASNYEHFIELVTGLELKNDTSVVGVAKKLFLDKNPFDKTFDAKKYVFDFLTALKLNPHTQINQW